MNTSSSLRKATITGVIFACFLVLAFSAAFAAAPKGKAKAAKTTTLEEPFVAEVEKVFKVQNDWCLSFVGRDFVLHLTTATRLTDERGAALGIKEAPDLLLRRALKISMTRDAEGRFVARELVLLTADRLFELRRSEAAKPPAFRGLKDGTGTR